MSSWKKTGNYARFMRTILQCNRRRLALPYRATLLVTYRCNARCQICNVWKKPRVNELTAEEWDRVFSRANDFSWLDISGGEIFMRSDIAQLFDIMIAHSPKLLLLHFPTNGLMTDRILALAQAMASRRTFRTVITVSLDGPARVNDPLRGVPGAFDRTLNTFRELRAMNGIEVYLGMTLSHANLGLLEETMSDVRRYVPDMRWDELHLNVLHHSAHYFENTGMTGIDAEAVLRDLQAYLQHRTHWLSPFGWLEKQFFDRTPVYLRSRRTPLPCQALNSTCFIDPEGTLFPCSIFSSPVGNLRDCNYDLPALWNSAKAKGLLDTISRGGCPHCWTACEAYPALFGNLLHPVRFLRSRVQPVARG